MTTIRKSYTFKNQPKYTTTITSKYKLNSDDGGDYPIHIVEDPIPEYDNGDDRPDHTHYDYDITAKKKQKQKIVYHCGDDYIEVPGGTDSVVYTDDEGQSYEVSIDDLIEYDGDDGEIQYTSGRKGKKSLKLSHKLQDKVPPVIMARQSAQFSMFQHTFPRVYS